MATKLPIPKYGEIVTAGYAPGESGIAKFDPNTGKALKPTIEDQYKGLVSTNSSEDKAYSNVENYYKKQSQQNINEDDIYSKAARRFQKEIDATNQIYREKLRQQQEISKGNLGTSTAISARSGTLGSPIGEAQYRGVQQQNQAIEGSVRAEQAATIAAILGKGRAAAAEEIAAKRAAKEAGLKDYLGFLKDKQTRTATKLSGLAKSLIAKGLKIDTIDPLQLAEIAKTYGVSSNDILTAYQEESTKKKADYLSVSEGQTVIDPVTGEVVFQAPKTYKPSAGGAGGLTPYQQFQATQSISKDNQARTENAREMARQAALIDQSYNNIVNGGDRSLNTQAIITSFNKILDPASVVRESEYDRTAAGQSLLARLEGKVQNIAQGGAGVTESTLKEASDIAKAYLDGAKQTIKAQNERAVAMAKQFGLNPDFVSNTYQGGLTKSIADYQAEFPQATPEELQALIAEEQGL